MSSYPGDEQFSYDKYKEQMATSVASELLIRKSNVILDATVMTSLMACERYLDMRFNNNLIPLRGHGNPIEAGSIVHKILEEFVKALIAGKSRVTAIDLGMQAGDKLHDTCENVPEENEKDKQGKLKVVGWLWIQATMEQYFKRWINDSWTPIEAEQVKRSLVYEDDDIRVMWVSKLDRIVDTFKDGIMPIDHKTMKQNRDPLLLNNQFMGQCLIAKTHRMCIDKIGFQTSLKPEEKFVRQIMSYTAAQLAEQVEVIAYYAKYLVSLQQQGYYPPRYTHCDKYNGCMYKRVCESDPNDRDRMIKLSFKIGEEWNPEGGDDD